MSDDEELTSGVVRVIDEEFISHVVWALRFLAACELQIRADALLGDAQRLEARGFNLPWARNRRRAAWRLRRQARALAPGAYEGEYPAFASDDRIPGGREDDP